MHKNQLIEELENSEDLTELDIIKYPSRSLKRRAEGIVDFNKEVGIDTVKNMLYTMRLHNGVGIAGTQVGINKQIAIVNVKEPYVMINPVMYKHSTTTEEIEEGSINIPDYFYTVKRYCEITVGFEDMDGEYHTLEADGLLSYAIQHQLDSLNGKLFLDKLSPVKRFFIDKKIKKVMKNYEY